MRSLQALALQTEFAANLTRVGVPITPPIYDLITAKIEVIQAQQVKRERAATHVQARLHLTNNKRMYMLTKPFVQTLMAVMEERLSSMRDNAMVVPRLTEDDVSAALDNDAEWLRLSAPFEVPPRGTKFFNELLLIVDGESEIDSIHSNKTIIRVVLTRSATEDGSA
jgi:hypothetical protein